MTYTVETIEWEWYTQKKVNKNNDLQSHLTYQVHTKYTKNQRFMNDGYQECYQVGVRL